MRFDDQVPPMRTAELHSVGVTPGELAGPRWASPFRGLHRPADPTDRSTLQRILDVAEIVPSGGAIGGWAAAFLLGAHDLDGRGRSGTERHPVPVILPPPVLIRSHPGIRRWRSALDADDVLLCPDGPAAGVPCTTARRTGFDLARSTHLRDGVVALDALGRQIGLSPAAVLGYAVSHRGWRGVGRVAPAVELADPRARSTWETRFRLSWVLDAGLPRPQVNPRVFDLAGHLLGEVDLLDPEAAMVGEYDGGQHRELDGHVLDNAREEWIEDTGLIVVRACSPDLRPVHLTRTVRRLQVAHRRGMGRDRGRDRWIWRPGSAQ